jgi:hypothetical protein
MLKKLLRNSKGLSPIFASLIILSVVTVLFVPVFIWAAGLTVQTEESWQQSGVAATERIVIEEVNLKSVDSKIYVRNIGKTTVDVSNVLIASQGDSGIIYPFVEGNFSVDKPLAGQGDLITITIQNLGFTLATGSAYSIQVFTNRGVGDTYQVVA